MENALVSSQFSIDGWGYSLSSVRPLTLSSFVVPPLNDVIAILRDEREATGAILMAGLTCQRMTELTAIKHETLMRGHKTLRG